MWVTDEGTLCFLVFFYNGAPGFAKDNNELARPPSERQTLANGFGPIVLFLFVKLVRLVFQFKVQIVDLILVFHMLKYVVRRVNYWPYRISNIIT